MAQDYLKLLQLLSDSGCEFVIVGGVAAFLHGGRRVTYDLDIVPELDEASWPALIDAIAQTGSQPRIPETLDAIKDLSNNVNLWMRDKGMLALNFRST